MKAFRQPETGQAHITGLSHESGVARQNGKAIFIDGALPGENVRYLIHEHKKNFARARLMAVDSPSALRATPICPVYAACGGCSWQHVRADAQPALKQRLWEEQMQRLGPGQPDILLPALVGQAWRYRMRARWTIQSGKLGFMSKGSHHIAATNECLIVPAHVSAMLPAWQALLGRYPDAAHALSFAQGEGALAWVVHMHRLPESAVLGALRALIDSWPNTQLWRQIGEDAAELDYPAGAPDLTYRLPEFNLVMRYRPQDFTQINHAMNARMVSRAMTWLAPKPHEKIIDWFCGLGNFSLPAARLGAQVTGVEGSASMVRRAQALAQRNAVPAQFMPADLFQAQPALLESLPADKWLLDPPRAGALALVSALANLMPSKRPQRIVYVSCDAGTLARDARILCNMGYRFRAGGIINLFAQSSHVESFAVFEST